MVPSSGLQEVFISVYDARQLQETFSTLQYSDYVYFLARLLSTGVPAEGVVSGGVVIRAAQAALVTAAVLQEGGEEAAGGSCGRWQRAALCHARH